MVDQQTLANLVLSGAEDDVHAAHARLDDTRAALSTARRGVAAAQRDYDVTASGIEALEKAAADATSPTLRARALARLSWARGRAEAIDHLWKQSSAYTEQRVNRSRSTGDLSGLRRELVERRCAEHGVISPPRDARAAAAWADSPDGALLARAVAVVGGSADLTFMLPEVTQAPDVEAAHWANVPLRWVPTTTTAWMARARSSQRPWSPTREVLVDAVQSSGQARTARRGAFVDARRGDTWWIAPVTGPTRLPETGTVVEGGWIAVRDRDGEVRVLDDLDRFQAPA